MQIMKLHSPTLAEVSGIVDGKDFSGGSVWRGVTDKEGLVYYDQYNELWDKCSLDRVSC